VKLLSTSVGYAGEFVVGLGRSAKKLFTKADYCWFAWRAALFYYLLGSEITSLEG
jgi:hypothetical protein